MFCAIFNFQTRSRSKNLNKDEQRVFKTILLLQAISQKTGNSVQVMIRLSLKTI